MSRRRPAVTLFQLLLLIALLAIGFALFLPAIGAARLEEAKRASMRNLRMIGIGAHSYHDAVGHFPPGIDANGFSAAAHLLPYIEQDAVLRMIDLKKSPTEPANAKARAVVIKTFVNPLDPVTSVTTDAGPTNYLFCMGTLPDLKKNDGCFYAGSQQKIQTIPDGSSNTMMAGETLKGDSAVKAVTVARQHVALKADALAGIKPDAGVADWKADKNIAADRGASWMDGKFLQGTFNATRTVNDDKPDVTCAGLGGLSGLRGGPDGVWVLLADGSTRRLTSKVPLNVIQIIAGTSDGLVTPDF